MTPTITRITHSLLGSFYPERAFYVTLPTEYLFLAPKAYNFYTAVFYFSSLFWKVAGGGENENNNVLPRDNKMGVNDQREVLIPRRVWRHLVNGVIARYVNEIAFSSQFHKEAAL